MTCLDEELVSKKTLPRVLRVVVLVPIDKDGPVRPSDCELLVFELFPYPRRNK